jgi:hypothetical protein
METKELCVCEVGEFLGLTPPHGLPPHEHSAPGQTDRFTEAGEVGLLQPRQTG